MLDFYLQAQAIGFATAPWAIALESLEYRFSIHSFDKKPGFFGSQQGNFGLKGHRN
ncbi:MAG: hypothetical protein KME30_04935 [Iphinoe sp. HA4291-MV1]|nr:hypothetical protein [Iphinoe sp. HA4291-MV1]